MKTMDVYRQYFAAVCTFNGVERRGVDVWLTAESDSGIIRYEVGVTFFPHRDEEDFAVSYDACGTKELLRTKGRRSKKRDEQFLAQVRESADEIAASFGGMIRWDAPLRDARYGCSGQPIYSMSGYACVSAWTKIIIEKERMMMEKYICPCGYEYDPEQGDYENGVAPGTKWEDVPEDWVCPVCGLGKDLFEKA